jgi:hypothetical protein
MHVVGWVKLAIQWAAAEAAKTRLDGDRRLVRKLHTILRLPPVVPNRTTYSSRSTNEDLPSVLLTTPHM